LAALRVHAQVAQRAVSDAQRERALAQVIAGVDQAGHLVDQLLTLSRLEGQGAVTMDGEVSLTGTARRCAEDLEPMAQDRSVSLRVTGADDIVARGNEDAIYILLRNLIDNAIRYTPAGGEVSVMVRRWGLFSRIIIDDSGPGIADGQADDMFQRFRRGPDTGMPGSGLGLSIARQICEFHGGGVQLENREEGGLRCDVWLPVPTEPAADGSDAKDGLAEPRGFWQRFRQSVTSMPGHPARRRRRTD
jgi:signal transduction histidine kinase